MSTYSDEELLECIQEIDQLVASTSQWEANFIESVLERGEASFSPRQREVVESMINKYLKA